MFSDCEPIQFPWFDPLLTLRAHVGLSYHPSHHDMSTNNLSPLNNIFFNMTMYNIVETVTCMIVSRLTNNSVNDRTIFLTSERESK